MDAEQWHQQATRAPRTMTPPASGAALHSMTDAERMVYSGAVRASLRSLHLRSPVHEHARGALSDGLASALLEPQGARTMLALSAPWGVGKSTLVKDWAAAQHRDWLGEKASDQRPCWQPSEGTTADLVPVIYLTLLSESRSKDLYAQILNFIGYPISGAERTIALSAVRALRTHRVRMIVVDDAHMLRTASITGRATLNAVKHLNTELGEAGGCMVLVGADLARGEALADPQIRARLSETDLHPYGAQSTEERRQWQRFLKSCENVLLPYAPGAEPGLFASQYAGYLWTRTQGYVGDTATLLVDALHGAISDNSVLSRVHLDGVRLSERAQDGWERLNSTPRKRSTA